MKRVKQIFLLILVVGVGYAVYFLSQAFPIIAG